MRRPRITELLLGASLLAPLLGLPQATLAQNDNAANECDRLITTLQLNGTANNAVTLDQARTYKNASDVEACRTALDKMQDSKDNTRTESNSRAASNSSAVSNAGAGTETAGTGATVVVQQAAPTISVESPSPQVTVQQAAPTVSVNQGQPEVIVHQPAPIVTIEIPKPEITLRMPKPTVEVAQAVPQVVVNQAKPDVRVVQAKPEINTTTAQANVDVNQTANPIIHYESEQPQVRVNQAQGEPTIKVEQFDRTASNDRDRRGTPSSTASLSESGPHVMASELNGKSVLGPQGQKLGTVKAVILDAQNRPFIVVERTGLGSAIGSSIGLLAKQIPISAQNAKLDGGQVMIQGLTMAQINGIREYKSEPNYRTVEGDQPIAMNRS